MPGILDSLLRGRRRDDAISLLGQMDSAASLGAQRGPLSSEHSSTPNAPASLLGAFRSSQSYRQLGSPVSGLVGLISIGEEPNGTAGQSESGVSLELSQQKPPRSSSDDARKPPIVPPLSLPSPKECMNDPTPKLVMAEMTSGPPTSAPLFLDRMTEANFSASVGQNVSRPTAMTGTATALMSTPASLPHHVGRSPGKFRYKGWRPPAKDLASINNRCVIMLES